MTYKVQIDDLVRDATADETVIFDKQKADADADEAQTQIN